MAEAAERTNPPPAPPCVLVIFGARGDLARRLLVPSLYNLARAGLLDDGFKVLGVDHGKLDDDGFRRMQSEAFHERAKAGDAHLDEAAWAWLEQRLFYQIGDFAEPAAYQALGQRLEALHAGDVLFYLATAPRFFGEVVDQLGKAGLTKEADGRFRRVVIEKPFGEDLASAKALNARILASLNEGQIYRIDHFLGKETVRNIMVTRFGNGVFEPLWNRLHIDHVQITAAETVGVEDRGGYYDQAGALRDMAPNHLFQLLALVAMEPPNSFDADEVRAEKTRTIQAIVQQTPEQALENSARGQYRGGEAGGRPLADYRTAENVDPDSRTETYAAVKLTIDNWRWAGVPFYLRTGKAMTARDTEVAIRFKGAPAAPFGPDAGTPAPNTLVIQIQPDEGITLQVDVKQPGPDVRLQTIGLGFCYADYFDTTPQTGYETLIYDCLIGDQTLFKTADEIEYAWRAVEPFLSAWSRGEPSAYAAGSAGPDAAEQLLARDGRRWRPVGRETRPRGTDLRDGR